MSKGWPDPFNDRGDDFWDFDNMVNEYEFEQKRRTERQQQLQQPQHSSFQNKEKKPASVGWIIAVITLLAATVVGLAVFTPVGIVLLIVLVIVLFSR